MKHNQKIRVEKNSMAAAGHVDGMGNGCHCCRHMDQFCPVEAVFF